MTDRDPRLKRITKLSEQVERARERLNEALSKRTALADELDRDGVPWSHIGEAAGQTRQALRKMVMQRREAGE